MSDRINRGDAHIGDIVTPINPISQEGVEPRFQPGDLLTVKHVGGDVVLSVEDAGGKRGTWVCSCFRFAVPKSQEQLLREALVGVLGALEPLKVMGQSVVALDHKLTAAVRRAEALTKAKPLPEPPHER